MRDFAIALFIVILLAAFVEASDRHSAHADRDDCNHAHSSDC